MRISFADCQSDRVDALMAFFSHVYSPTHPLACNEPLVRWQFRGPVHASDGYHVKLALVDDEIQASLGYIPVELTVSGQIVRAAWTANWMVAPACRRLGLGPLLLRELMDEFDAVLSVGLERDACQILPRMGWHDFGDLTRYVFVIDRAAAATLTPEGKLKWPVPRRTSRGAPREAFDGAAAIVGDGAAIWDRAWSGRVAGTRRSVAFLKWRYIDHPALKYRFIAVPSAHGGATGVAVYRVENVRDLPVKVGRVVEFMAAPPDAPALIAALQEDARAHGVALLDFFCATRRFDDALSNAGFLTGDTGPAREIPIVFQPIDRQRSGIRFMAHLRKVSSIVGVDGWYVTKGDGDQDRPN